MGDYRVTWSGRRLFLNRKRLVEGIDWLTLMGEEVSILIHEDHEPKAGQMPDMMLIEEPASERFFKVDAVEHLDGKVGCPWKWVVLREINLLDELRAAESSLPS